MLRQGYRSIFTHRAVYERRRIDIFHPRHDLHRGTIRHFRVFEIPIPIVE